MAQIGVNAWVWTSPVNTEEFGRLAPMVKRMGFADHAGAVCIIPEIGSSVSAAGMRFAQPDV